MSKFTGAFHFYLMMTLLTVKYYDLTSPLTRHWWSGAVIHALTLNAPLKQSDSIKDPESSFLNVNLMVKSMIDKSSGKVISVQNTINNSISKSLTNR